MQTLAILTAAAGCFCLGAAIPCCCLAYLNLKKRPDRAMVKLIFSLVLSLCFLCSLFVIFLAFDLSFPELIALSGGLWYFAGFIIAGLISSLFYKIVLPIVLGLYIIYATASSVWIYHSLRMENTQFPLRIEADKITIGDESYMEAAPVRYIVFETISIPPTFLLPVPERWLREITVTSDPLAEIDSLPILANEAFGLADMPQPLSEALTPYFQKLTAHRKRHYVEIPEQDLLPKEYTLSCSVEEGDFIYSLE